MPEFKTERNLAKYLVPALLAAVTGYLIAMRGASVIVALTAIPVVAALMILFFKHPKTGLYFALIMSFMVPAFDRYLPVSFPFGLTIDIMLVLTFVVLFFRNWKRLDLSLAKNDITLLMVLWMGYITLQLFNPEAQSRIAWFYAMRGLALYQVLTIPLAFVLLNTRKDWNQFLAVFLGFSVAGILWAVKQKTIGVDAYEQRWLDAGGAVTHVLFGQLRAFSYYFDAGTFGAAMGQVNIMALILFLGPYSRRRKAAFLLISVAAFYALVLSGTRGALAVPGIGGILYLIMTRNFKMLILGGGLLLMGFLFLKYTTIGNSNYDISRLRSALNFNDPSLNVRLYNRERLSEYLVGKPFGGGVGTTGSWGRRFSPGTWLASFEPDGLYTTIRAETGVIGYIFYVCMWIYILIKGIVVMWRFPDRERRNIAMAILAGFAGILVANYGNSVLTQLPISLITYISITFVFSMRYWNENGKIEIEGREVPVQGKRPDLIPR